MRPDDVTSILRDPYANPQEDAHGDARPMLTDADLEAVLLDPNPTAPTRRRGGVTLTRDDRISVERVRWVWHSRIPAGMTTLVAGREGMGKTGLCGWIMARISRGQLPGDWHGHPADVVYVGAEDDRSSVLVPRLIAAGADLGRVHFVDDAAAFGASASDAFTETLAPLDNLALVIIDPLDAHLGDRVDTHRKADVQRAFATLAAAVTAAHASAAVVGIAHLSKGDSLDVLRRVVGSVGFTTSARSVLAVGEHPDEPRDRVCVARKANMTDTAGTPALRFRVEAADVPHPDGGTPIVTAGVVILGEEHGLDPDMILSVPSAAERSQLDEAADWLADYLAEGPRPASDVERAAGQEGISRPTLHRARRRLGVVSDRDDKARGRPSTWRLAAAPDPVPSHGVSFRPQGEPDGTKSGPPPTRENAPPAGVSFHVSAAGGNVHDRPADARSEARPCAVCGGPGRPYLNANYCTEHVGMSPEVGR